MAADDLTEGQKVPALPEREVVGMPTRRIKRGTSDFAALVKNTNVDIVFKNEEGRDDDQYMTSKLSLKVDALAALVKAEWPGKKLRVTEAWDDESDPHKPESTHYEARAVDITVSDQDGTKLGRLGRLAVNAGFGWVWYEDSLHVHASVSI